MKKGVICFIVTWMIAGIGISVAKNNKIDTDHFTITYENISQEQARDFGKKAEKAFIDVTQYLGMNHKKKIRIDISDRNRFPFTTKDKKIILPANRIRGDAGGPPEIAGRGPCIAHEITHVVASKRRPPFHYLDEGLAVYMQEKFGDDKSWPNMGIDVHELTARMMKDANKRVPLKKGAELKRGSDDTIRRLVYLQEGSFSRFLIEKYGLQNYLLVFKGKSYKKIYKKGFDDIEKEWRQFIKNM